MYRYVIKYYQDIKNKELLIQATTRLELRLLFLLVKKANLKRLHTA